MIALLDYGAGNVRSLRNAVHALGFALTEIERPEDILCAERLILPGVGSFGAAMRRLEELGYLKPLKDYLSAGRPFLGICLGLQILFAGSEESPGVPGLGIIPGQIRRFPGEGLSVPHMGWNAVRLQKHSPLFTGYAGEPFYFVHSYRALPGPENADWQLAFTDYGRPFLSAVQRGAVCAVQFHPEKSGQAGLALLRNFLAGTSASAPAIPLGDPTPTRLTKRIVACLDVRTNDQGDLVVTKGDQYDVREKTEGRAVRNLGKPVELAERYYQEGADEIAFLNITAFRASPLADQPMLEVLRRTSERVFVPLTIGGGIRAYTDGEGRSYSALAVAHAYFRAGADKVSIGSDAVLAVEDYLARGRVKDGSSAIEQIAAVYGNQAVVISIDPRRVYVNSPQDTPHTVIETRFPGPKGERYCWFQCTIKGGREGRDLDVVELARTCEALGAGEILLNSIDRDGTGAGFDLELIRLVRESVSIPVIASSGAGCVEHFAEVFCETGVEAALAAGIFHRREVPIEAVKSHLITQGIEIRNGEGASTPRHD
ncbi:imidazole glycerol phosphate synthase subunit HisF [Caldichromatium japonicum]|uniref:Imidazole glycerol phosphate synthase subunit HisH n=1 Tax=Caldichromatium japonicum TaxID=2699430 RepID=A0A6G7VF00_9GAMM|nr:imidazole glycerol phosphate synthase subunit HisF [Caldichromatium japonicum]QIK38446.1 imidazole glycerol phosphate synthase subunit HisF [Caldichromatium japonicum]